MPSVRDKDGMYECSVLALDLSDHLGTHARLSLAPSFDRAARPFGPKLGKCTQTNHGILIIYVQNRATKNFLNLH